MNKDKITRHVRELQKRKPPLLVVNAVIQKGEEVLLIKRGKEPAKGSWVVPGGHVLHNESLEEAVVREVKEETGLDVEIVGIISTKTDREGLDPRGYHLSVNYLTIPVGGELQKTSEAMEIKWFKLGYLPTNMGLASAEYFQETISKENQISELVKYAPPMPMVNQIIYKDRTKILLGKRNKPPYFSDWGLPGGHFSFNESIEDASIRKAKQETGLEVRVEKVVAVHTDFGVDPRSKNLIIVHLCKFISGELRKSDDFSDFIWYNLHKPLPKKVRVINPSFIKEINKAKKFLLEAKGGIEI